MNALPTVRQWRRIVHPDLQLETGRGGRYRLPVIADLMRIHIPEKYGANVAALGIKSMREALAEAGTFGGTTSEAKRVWKALLGHNRLDCRIAEEIVRRAADEYAAAKS